MRGGQALVEVRRPRRHGGPSRRPPGPPGPAGPAADPSLGDHQALLDTGQVRRGILPGVVDTQVIHFHPARRVQPVQQPGVHRGPVDPWPLVRADHRHRRGRSSSRSPSGTPSAGPVPTACSAWGCPRPVPVRAAWSCRYPPRRPGRPGTSRPPGAVGGDWPRSSPRWTWDQFTIKPFGILIRRGEPGLSFAVRARAAEGSADAGFAAAAHSRDRRGRGRRRGGRSRGPGLLRLENLDTDLRPPAVALRQRPARRSTMTRRTAICPFQGHGRCARPPPATSAGQRAGCTTRPRECVSVAGGLNGILNALLATVEPGQEVVLCDPIYAGLVNRIRLAGGVPRHRPAACRRQRLGAPTRPSSPRRSGRGTAAVLLMGPAMPTGACWTREHYRRAGRRRCSASRRLAHLRRGDGAHPLRRAAAEPPGHAPGPGRPDHHRRVGVQGTADDRLAGRLGGRAARRSSPTSGWSGLTNVVCQVGIAQARRGRGADAPRTRTRTWPPRPRSGSGAARSSSTSCRATRCVRPDGGWSLLVDTRPLGLTPGRLSRRLFELGQVAATPMTGWGPQRDMYLRLVFANEPVERLGDLRARFDAAFG